LRQQWERPGQADFRALADYIAPRESGRTDYVGAFAVTAGIGCDELCRQFDREHDDYNSIMAKALADRLAEAFAELVHQEARCDWQYGQAEDLTSEQLIDEQYRGIRPAPGYPSQQARYFALDRITREQAEDYARRKGLPLAEIERWLAPNLGYEP
jgi:5-methyltetrahydrofolate--homocysteine methyltransferase